MTKFKYSLDNKRYHTLNYFFKNNFNSKVFKVSLNGNFTCPNIDGTKGYGGCIYCLNGSNENDKKQTLKEQFDTVRSVIDKKWPNSKYIAYFQANSSTYASVDVLKEKYEEVLKYDNVIGLTISTRSDCISDEVLEYLIDLNKITYLTIELGLQTIHEKTSKLINRCHTLDNFTNVFNKLKENNINVCIHVINGLPYETKEMMLETIKYVNRLNPWGIKIHMLSVLKGTALENLYKREHFKILSKEEYVDITCSELELLNENIVINRITGDPIINDLIEPFWLTKKFCVLNDIDKELVKRDSYQGKKKEL